VCEWQSIDKAPKDGTVVIVRGAYDYQGEPRMLAAAAQFRDGAWWRDNNGYGFTVSCYPTEFIEIEATK
jgi:hypothetical protein